jgi:arylsulfatase
VAPARSLVLVVADALRRDRPGAYGGSVATPHFDAFARANLLFDRVSAQAPWTKPSIATLFTSLYPTQHRVASDPQLQGAFGVMRTGQVTEADVLGGDFVTLAEVLTHAGARAGAVVANPWLLRRYGFAQGFEHYDERLASWDAPGREVSDTALAWLARVPEGQRFFLYVHYMDAHRPYGRLDPDAARAIEPDARVLDANGLQFVRGYLKLADGRGVGEAGVTPSAALVESAYDRGVANFDAALGVLLEGLAARADRDRTAIVVTADHGEGLYERGYGNHGGGLFELELAIPLAMRLPGVTPTRARLDCLLGLVDLMPTFCDLMGAACPEGLAGRSLLDPDLEPTRFLLSEGVMTRPANRAIRGRRYKLIHEPDGRRDERDALGPTSMYELGATGEQGPDLLAEGDLTPELAVRRDALQRALEEGVPAWTASEPERAPVAPALRQRLRALGYGD